MLCLQTPIFLAHSSIVPLISHPLSPLLFFVARKVAMFSFCAVMTDVNYAPFNGPPSPLLTSGISHSLIPILRELGMDVSISAGSPQGWP